MFPSILTVLVIFSWSIEVRGHGRLMEPPNRSSLWRLKEFAHLNPPVNYNDNELSCGGFANQYDQNNGLCGPCGDPYDAPVPRANENGGLYGRGIIARRYFGGQEISVTVELTRSHLGYFVFQLCPLSNPNGIETESCFGYPLQLSDGTGYKYHVSTMAVGNFETSLVLPRRACPHCVLRWHYRTGNSWGDCGNGTGALGCGNQEVFRGCADIVIE